MTDSNANTLPMNEETSRDAQSGEPHEVRWEIVTTTSGLMAAEIIVGRLQAEGIPARAWQEGAGEALGLIVGKLGTGNVAVPEEFAEQAREILAEAEAEAEMWFEEEE